MYSLNKMKKRIGYIGYTTDERFDNNKLYSFEGALNNSYQAETIEFNNENFRCLINPDKITDDYDKKEISIGFESKITAGDTFYWPRTESHWLVYQQRYEESAYFRAQIIKCDYQLEVNGKKYWIYLRGPNETEIVELQKYQGITTNKLNYGLYCYITKDKNTLDFFTRHQIVKFDNHNWQTAVVDRYTQKGIIEIYLDEYYDNPMEDAMKDINESELKEIISMGQIQGKVNVKPFDMDLEYKLDDGITGGKWKVSNKTKAQVTQKDDNSCLVDIKTSNEGQFDLIYEREKEEDIKLTINILPMHKEIRGHAKQ